MTAGKLPDQRPERLWGGAGSGQSCAVCGKTIGKEDVEMELQFTSEGGAGTANYHVHAQCFALWERGRRNGGSNDHSLPPEGNEGIIPGHERNPTNRRGRD